MRFLFVLLFAAFIMQSQAQYSIMHMDVIPLDTVRPKFGPNGHNFIHSYYGLHSIIPLEVNDKAPVIPGLSMGYKAGVLGKFRVCDFLAFGYIFEFNTFNYRFKQSSDKNFPDTLNHLRQNIVFTTLGSGLFLRINFDARRGNYLGYFLDMGGYADWNMSRVYKSKDKNDMDELVYSRITRLYFTEQYQYGLYANIGLNKINIYARYRVSDLFKSPFKSAELPRLNVGLGFSIF